MSAPSPPRTPKAGARRQRWVIIVGGTPDQPPAPSDPHLQHLCDRGTVVAIASSLVRDRGGRVPVCVWRVGGRWPARSPTWWFDPRGLPEAWAPRGQPPPKHPLPPCTCAEYGARGDATPTRTCSVCGCPTVGGVRP